MNERQTQANLERDKKYLASFFDPENLEELLGQGFQRRVYALKSPLAELETKGIVYDVGLRYRLSGKPLDQMVVKVPRTEYVFPASSTLGTLNELEVGMRYFSRYAVQPTLLVVQDQRYCLIQRRLERFDYLNPQNILQVKDQVEDIFGRQQQLVRDGMFMSMLGFEGIRVCTRALFDPKINPFMSNVVIEQTKAGSNLRVPDFTIYNIRITSLHPKDLVTQLPLPLYNLYYQVSERLIRHHFSLVV